MIPGETPLTASEVADRLGMSLAWVWDQFEAGQLPGYRMGGRKGCPLRFYWSEVEPVVESWRIGPKSARSERHLEEVKA